MLLATVLGLPGDSGVNNPPTTQEMRVRSLGWEDPLEKEKGTCSSILAWKIPWTERLCGLQSMRSLRHDWVTDHAHTAFNWKDGGRKPLPGLPSAIPQRLFYTLTSLPPSTWAPEKRTHTPGLGSQEKGLEPSITSAAKGQMPWSQRKVFHCL